MEINDIILLIWCAIGCAVGTQSAASGNIGNRGYSIWYSTHFLIEKQGICSLIYFKPKHFERYTLYEVISFFATYLCVIVLALLGVLRYLELLSSQSLYLIASFIVVLVFCSDFAIIILNEIGSRRDEKKKFFLESGEREQYASLPEHLEAEDNEKLWKVINLFEESRNHPYFTIHNLRDSYHTRLKEAKNDFQKQKQVHLDYIEYFKNMEHLVVVKENKNGSLQLKIQK